VSIEAGAVSDGQGERTRPYRILFVCLGNICRSPTAEGVMRALVREAGLHERIELDSAGTGAWHIDEPPDARATTAARERGVELEGRAKLRLLRDFDPDIDGEADVPDPYHGGSRGFDDVFDLVHRSCGALLAELRAAA
jgi:protein-tyrosine phosphatase